ncbi:MAG: hypothetical protein QNJ88_07845 [Acidimicrobiia bacterium]|nr:hypothetical protein [Acidimicrobiia bacterium]
MEHPSGTTAHNSKSVTGRAGWWGGVAEKEARRIALINGGALLLIIAVVAVVMGYVRTRDTATPPVPEFATADATVLSVDSDTEWVEGSKGFLDPQTWTRIVVTWTTATGDVRQQEFEYYGRQVVEVGDTVTIHYDPKRPEYVHRPDLP